MTPAEILNSDYGRHPLGWGPFVVDEWVAGDHISLSRKPHYWRAGFPKVDRLVFRFGFQMDPTENSELWSVEEWMVKRSR